MLFAITLRSEGNAAATDEDCAALPVKAEPVAVTLIDNDGIVANATNFATVALTLGGKTIASRSTASDDLTAETGEVLGLTRAVGAAGAKLEMTVSKDGTGAAHNVRAVVLFRANL